MNRVEREVKLALASEADYQRAVAELPGFIGEVEQNNTYWDSAAGNLKQARILLRLRLEGEGAWLTAKHGPRSRDGGRFEVPEQEEPVDLAAAQRVVAGELPLAALGTALLPLLETSLGVLEGLHCWGTTRNLRRRYRLDEDWIAELDLTTYPDGGSDWEVELEGEELEVGQRLLEQALRDLGIRFTPQTRTKVERLVARPSTPGR